MSALRHRFISLGGDCQPAFHIRRLGSPSSAFFFDWLTAPITAITPLMEDHFANAFADITWKKTPHAWDVTDAHGLIAAHAFKSRDDNDIKTVVRAFRRLGEALLEIFDDPEPVVFVRRWSSVDGDAGSEEARKILAYLVERKQNTALLYLQQHDETVPIIEGNFLACYNPPTMMDWEGDHAVYDRNYWLADRIAAELFSNSFAA